MSIPYFPMYPADFEADTSHLSFEEDGAYNRLLRLMWMTPGCSLPDDPQWIARRMRTDAATYSRLIAPLIDEFMTRKSGRIFSARLRSEFEKADETYRKRSEAGKRGGRPKAVDNKGNASKAGLSQPKGGPKQPEPEPEPELEGKPSNIQGEFEAVWKAYPRKVGKGAAAKAWAKARKSTPFIAIVEPLARFATVVRGTDPQFIPHLSTWLNERRWEDEPDHAANRPRTSTDDLEALSRIDSTADLENLFTPTLRIVKQ